MTFVRQFKVESDQVQFLGKQIVSPLRNGRPVKAIELDDRIIIEFYGIGMGPEGERNVFAFDSSARILWRIERYLKVEPDLTALENYVDLRFDGMTGLTYISTIGGDRLRST